MNRITCSIVLFLITFFLRTFWIDSAPPQADEHHWKTRSFKIVEQYRAGNYAHLTTHLGQPGIPATLAIAAGEVLGERYNDSQNLKYGDPGYFDHLLSGRLSISFITSLLIPVVFLLVASLSGNNFLGFGAGLFLALDPQNIAHSRILHLDGMLTFLATLTAGLFFLAVEKKSVLLKIVAGVFWGLCIAVKPTAGSLIAGFLVYKLLRLLFTKDGERSIICWGDIWAVVVGHIVFALLYTRTWHRPWDYVERMGITNPLTEPLYQLSGWLRLHWVVTAGLGAVILILLFWIVVKLKSRHAFSFASLSVLFSAAFLLVPTVFENIILYWTWAFGLKDKYHIAYGKVWLPPEGGYLGILFSRHPDLLTIGVVLGCLIILIRLFFVRKDIFDRFAIFSLILAIFWILPLSISGKQSLRYVQPAVPFLYIVAAYGFYFILLYLVKLLPSAIYLVVLLFSAASSWGIYEYLNWGPDHQLYCSSLSGGLKNAVAKKRPVPFSGHRQVLDFIHQRAESENRNERVFGAADFDSLSFAYRRYIKSEDRRLRFDFSMKPRPGYYFVVSHHYFEKSGDPEDLKDLEHLYSFAPMGVPLTSVYKAPLRNYADPMDVKILKLPRRAGKPRYYEQSKDSFVKRGKEHSHKVIFLSKDQGDSASIVFHGESFRFPQGKIALRIRARIPPVKYQIENLNLEQEVFKLMLGSCEKAFLAGEIGKEDFVELEMICPFKEGQGATLSSYWYGEVPVMLTDLFIVGLASEG